MTLDKSALRWGASILAVALLGLLLESKQKTTLECGGGGFDWDDEYVC